MNLSARLCALGARVLAIDDEIHDLNLTVWIDWAHARCPVCRTQMEDARAEDRSWMPVEPTCRRCHAAKIEAYKTNWSCTPGVSDETSSREAAIAPGNASKASATPIQTERLVHLELASTHSSWVPAPNARLTIAVAAVPSAMLIEKRKKT